MNELNVLEWEPDDAKVWLKKEGNFNDRVLNMLCDDHGVDGRCLLALSEQDFSVDPLSKLTLRDRKVLYVCVRNLQRDNQSSLIQLGVVELPTTTLYGSHGYGRSHDYSEYGDSERISPPLSEDGRAVRLQPEIWKALLALGYCFVVTWITAFVMVIVHDRVPDMKRYPPLPDIFLDNVPHIPWAFDMCEITGTLLFTIWLIVLLFHKHRFILMRRFFALSGTVFLLRCVTMLITSLSVPGAHLQCQPRTDNLVDCGEEGCSTLYGAELANKIARAYAIWRGAGMSIQGVRTCGDYMFSGHTVALTMLNFFITEYTPRHFYFLHTLTWLMNMFGIFFILAAHEHYSIDVFVAFYITSRLFLYYHTLSNNQALMQRDSTRTRIWFPLFSFFESSVDGIVPNEFDSPQKMVRKIIEWCTTKWRRLRTINYTFVYSTDGRHGHYQPLSSSSPNAPSSTNSVDPSSTIDQLSPTIVRSNIEVYNTFSSSKLSNSSDYDNSNTIFGSKRDTSITSSKGAIGQQETNKNK